MKPGVIIISTFVLFFFFVLSCGKDASKQTQLPSEIDSFKTGLVEKQIGTTNFYISIPGNFVIKEEPAGPDFAIYYFYLSDTTLKPTFICGVYFANHPNQF